MNGPEGVRAGTFERGAMVEVRDADKMRKAEKEVGENIPDEMIGMDSGDVRRVEHKGPYTDGDPDEDDG